MIQTLTVRQNGEPEIVEIAWVFIRINYLWYFVYVRQKFIIYFRHDSSSQVYQKLANSLILPLLVPVFAVAVGNFISVWTRARKRTKSYVFNRRRFRFWKFLPHLIYFCAVFTFTFSHHNFSDVIILIVTCPMVFWSISLLLRKPLKMDDSRYVDDAFKWTVGMFRNNFKYALVMTFPFYLYPIIYFYRYCRILIGWAKIYVLFCILK